MFRISYLDTIMLILLIIGGINWGLVGLFDTNLVSALFGDLTPLSRAVYGLVGIAAIYTSYILYKLKG